MNCGCSGSSSVGPSVGGTDQVTDDTTDEATACPTDGKLLELQKLLIGRSIGRVTDEVTDGR